MKWVNKHIVEILGIVLNTFLIINLMLSSYEVKSADGTMIITDFLSIAIPAVMISTGIIGLIRDRKLINLIVLLGGILFLYQTYSFEINHLSESISNINNKLSLSKELVYADFSFILKSVSILLIVASFMSTYIFPWNLIFIDLSFIFFIWSVDYFLEPEKKILPFILLWTFLIAHDRSRTFEERYSGTKEIKILKSKRLFQIITMSLIAATVSITISHVRKGPMYNQIWMKANDFLMQDDFLSGTKFLDTFSLMKSGYSDSSTRLGGNVVLNDRIALTIKGDVPLYLRGNTKHEYTGKVWKRNDYIYRTENIVSDEFLMYYSGVTKYTYEIKPVAVDTMSLFVPSYPESVMLSEKRDQRVYYSINDQTFMSNLPVKDQYTVSFFDESGIRNKAFSNSTKDVKGYEDFLSIPDSVTDRTKELTLSIIKGIDGNAQKAAAIRQYLKDNYKYTLEPGEVPDGDDFVDYFLFESKEGYCVYFGSAMTIMLRIAGIPSRYAEGFLVFNEREDDGTTIVRNSDAHAWAEMLTDPEAGIWTVIDATGTPRTQSANETPETQIPEVIDRPQTTTTPNTTTPSTTTPKDESGNLGGGNSSVEENKGLSPVFLLILPFIAMYLIKMLRIRNMVYSDDQNKFNKYIVTLLKESKVNIKDSDTLLEVSSKVREKELSRMIRRHAEYTNAANFGGKKVNSSSIDKFEILDQLYNKLGNDRNKVYAFFREYLI